MEGKILFENKSANAPPGIELMRSGNENSNLIQKMPWPRIELTHPREMNNQMKFRKRHSLESNSRIHGSQAPMKRIVSLMRWQAHSASQSSRG